MAGKKVIKKPEGISAEIQKYIDDLLADQQATLQEEFEEETEGLVAKRDELLKKVTALKKKQGNTEDGGGEDTSALEEQITKLQGDLAKANKELKKVTDKFTAAEQQLQSETTFTKRLVAENGLREALIEHGVKEPINQKAAMALLLPGVEVEADGANRIAKVGGKLLKDHVKAWAGTDEGKHFTSAPVNKGGGGGNGKGDGNEGKKTMTRAEFTGMSPSAQMEYSKAGNIITD